LARRWFCRHSHLKRARTGTRQPCCERKESGWPFFFRWWYRCRWYRSRIGFVIPDGRHSERSAHHFTNSRR